jgi:4-hydroxy-L-threonine phosphate dehydrogenase PdxA
MKRTLKLGYTYGDLGGVGPEIFHKFLRANQDRQDIQIRLIDDLVNYDEAKFTSHKADAYSGEHAYRVLLKADELLKSGELDYLITGPVAKESLWLAGIQCSGQTELLAKINNKTREDIEMFFVYKDFRVLLATRHVPIVDVPQLLNERLATVLEHGFTALTELFNIKNPRIAVAGLNPHAGENGIIGLEETKFIRPMIASSKHSDCIHGPFPADTLFARAVQKLLNQDSTMEYDLYIAAYHDQALPVMKGIGGLSAVNLTYGLPYIRLSVDHGTGFDIAGKNLASYEALTACTDYASKLSILLNA